MDRKVLEKMNYGVFVVGTQYQGKRVGCVVNSFAQVTSNLPQKFTLTLNRDNETCKALLESRTFAVTLAGKDCSKELINLFGYNAKYGIEGKPISTVHYIPQGYHQREPLYELAQSPDPSPAFL